MCVCVSARESERECEREREKGRKKERAKESVRECVCVRERKRENLLRQVEEAIESEQGAEFLLNPDPGYEEEDSCHMRRRIHVPFDKGRSFS